MLASNRGALPEWQDSGQSFVIQTQLCLSRLAARFPQFSLFVVETQGSRYRSDFRILELDYLASGVQRTRGIRSEPASQKTPPFTAAEFRVKVLHAMSRKGTGPVPGTRSPFPGYPRTRKPTRLWPFHFVGSTNTLIEQTTEGLLFVVCVKHSTVRVGSVSRKICTQFYERIHRLVKSHNSPDFSSVTRKNLLCGERTWRRASGLALSRSVASLSDTFNQPTSARTYLPGFLRPVSTSSGGLMTDC